MAREDNSESPQYPCIRDINTGRYVTIYFPDQFRLETVLINSAYYHYSNEEYRFLLCEARQAGLVYEKPKKEILTVDVELRLNDV
jgi:hypothetical protein